MENDLNDERLIRSLRQGGIMFGVVFPSFNRGGLQHLTNPINIKIHPNWSQWNSIAWYSRGWGHGGTNSLGGE